MDLGDFPVSGMVDFKWNTNGQDGASITRATNGSIRIYKDNSATERASAAGITDTEDFDTLTGVHHCRIDLSDNTDAGFYAAGSAYQVVLQGATIDTKAVNAVLAHFSIERAGGALALVKSVISAGRVLVLTGVRKNTAFLLHFKMISSVDHFSPKTGLVNGDFSVKATKIDSAGSAALSGTITEIDGGDYKISVTAAEVNGNTVTFQFSATGADDTTITIVTTP